VIAEALVTGTDHQGEAGVVVETRRTRERLDLKEVKVSLWKAIMEKCFFQITKFYVHRFSSIKHKVWKPF
jgi:hypothetical protein